MLAGSVRENDLDKKFTCLTTYEYAATFGIPAIPTVQMNENYS